MEGTFVRWDDVPHAAADAGGPWLVYALLDPIDNGVRYVGVTSDSLAARLRKHVQSPTNRRMRRWFRELRKGSRLARIELLSAPLADWQGAERGWIAWFRARGDLLNVDPGGICRDKKGRLIKALVKKPKVKKKSDGRRSGEVAAYRRLCGPVRVLSREEIQALYPNPERSYR